MRLLLLLVLIATFASTSHALKSSANRHTERALQPSTCKPGDIVVVGCNTCTCLSTGDRICVTQPGCDTSTRTPVPPANVVGNCMYDGKEYSIGSTRKAADGCNLCACAPQLTWICTNAECTSDVATAAPGTIRITTPTSKPVPETPPAPATTASPAQGQNTITSTRSTATSSVTCNLAFTFLLVIIASLLA